MKLLILSDIHGDYTNFLYILEHEICDQILFLGDMYGAADDENDLAVQKTLIDKNAIMVKGNCDIFAPSSLNLPLITSYNFNGIELILTHGNIYNEKNTTINLGQMLLLGHTHVARIDNINGIYIINPGSISRPRNNTEKSYATIDEEYITLKNIEGKVLKKTKYKF